MKLPRYALLALARERQRVQYMLELRCECRVSDDNYHYRDECFKRLFELPEGDELPGLPCGQVGTIRLGKEKKR